VDYIFVSTGEFAEMIEQGELLEYAGLWRLYPNPGIAPG
jgi:guanylate kinase